MSAQMNRRMSIRANIRSSIRAGILRIVSASEKPVSTLELCSQLKRAWHSVQNQCLQLQVEGKVEGFRVGNMNLWVKIEGGKNEEKDGKKRHQT